MKRYYYFGPYVNWMGSYSRCSFPDSRYFIQVERTVDGKFKLRWSLPWLLLVKPPGATFVSKEQAMESLDRYLIETLGCKLLTQGQLDKLSVLL